MDQLTNPLEISIDLAHSDHDLFSFQHQENSYSQNWSPFGFNQTKKFQKCLFFSRSSQLSHKQKMNNIQLAIEFKDQTILSKQIVYSKKFNFNVDPKILRKVSWSDQSQNQLCSNYDPFLPKKRDYQQFSCEQSKHSFELENKYIQYSISKNERGLKYLSKRMKQTLKNNKRTTFNQLSTQMIEDIKKKEKYKGKQMLYQDENNIRRRSYDALNVLIAAGVIEKIGKFIQLKKNGFNYVHPNSSNIIYQKSSNQKLFIDQSYRLQQKDQIIQRKLQELTNLAQKKINIQRFFKHKINYQHLDCNDKIKFPFVCIKTDTQNFKELFEKTQFNHQSIQQNQNVSTCDEYQQKNFILLKFKSSDLFNEVKIEGDIDVAAIIGKSLEQNQKE